MLANTLEQNDIIYKTGRQDSMFALTAIEIFHWYQSLSESDDV